MPRSEKPGVFSYWNETLYYPPELEPLFDFSMKYLYRKKQEWSSLHFELCLKIPALAEKMMRDFSYFQKLCRKRANVERKVVQWNKPRREGREVHYGKMRVLLTGAADAFRQQEGENIPICSRRGK
jgi:hypothetical protein